MNVISTRRFFHSFGICLLACLVFSKPMSVNAAEPPKVGDKAPDFSLKTLADANVELAELTKQGSVVVVVLRGYPGYQCPLCTRQVGQFIQSAKDFVAKKSNVVFVYPGASNGLGKYAAEFAESFKLPEGLHLVIDPDFKMIDAYNLRWDAPNETAYPSTFIVNTDGEIVYAKVSQEHGDRSDAKEVLENLPKAQSTN
jgi:thioredoxin-dependent peroxiredoxin